MIEFVKNHSTEKKKLSIGDIVVAGFKKYLIICDGYGYYFFLDLETQLLEAFSHKEPYKISCETKFAIGDVLIEPNSNTIIKEIIREKNYKMTVEF